MRMRSLIALLSCLGATAAADEPRGPDEHVGRYEAVFVDDDAAHRAAGHGGSGKKVRARIEISRAGDGFAARYAVGLAESPTPAATATLSDVQVEGDRFTAAPIAVKAAWPLYLPTHFEGRFEGPDTLVVEAQRYRRIQGTRMVAAYTLAAQQVAHPEPRLPAAFKASHPKRSVKAMYKVCLGVDGAVTDVTAMTPIPDVSADEEVRRQIREGWRYKPQAEPVCTASVIVFKIN